MSDKKKRTDKPRSGIDELAKKIKRTVIENTETVRKQRIGKRRGKRAGK